MSTEDSVTEWVQQVARGEQGAPQEQLARRFLNRLSALARRRLRNLGGIADEDDVALSAMKSFLMRAPRGEFQHLEDRDSLWSLLAAMTLRKVISTRRKMLAQKRDVRRTQSLDDLLARGTSREFVDSVLEEGHRILDSLEDPLLRQIAVARLEGYSNQEISEQIHRSVKTVERKLQLIRSRLATELARGDVE